jgi:hypothetical protein
MLAVILVATVHVLEDKEKMQIINTTAPIPIEELKKFFVNQETKFVIDYKNSKLKGVKLLTYLSNLDIPCDIDIDILDPEFYDLLKDYLNCPFIVNVQLLELATIHMLFQARGMLTEVAPNALSTSANMAKFIIENQDIINKWICVLDSLTLFNMYIINDNTFKEFVTSHEPAEDASTAGINFVSLLKHEVFYAFYETIDKSNMKYYKVYFDDYVFKGKNLYHYWANEANPLFLLTWSIASGTYKEELDKLLASQ